MLLTWHVHNVSSHSPHLDLVPGIHFAAVLLSDALILTSELIQGAAHVIPRLGINLHVHRAGINLATHGCHLLQAAQQSQRSGRIRDPYETLMKPMADSVSKHVCV